MGRAWSWTAAAVLWLLSPVPAPADEGGKGMPSVQPGKSYTLAQIQVASAHGDKPRRGEMIDGNRTNRIGSFWSTFQDTSRYAYDMFLPSNRYWYSLKTRYPYDFNFRFHGAAKDINVVQVWSRGNTFGGANVEVFAAREAPEGKVEGTPGYWPWRGVVWEEAPIGSFREGQAFTAGNQDEPKLTSILCRPAKTGGLRLRVGKSSEKGPDLVFVNEASFFQLREGAEEGGEAFTGAAAGPFAAEKGVRSATLKLALKKGPVTIKVIDPLYPAREHMLAALDAAGDGEATLALDVTDLVVPSGSKLSFEASGAEVKGGTVRTCEVKEALPEFQAMQVNVMQLWFSVQQLRNPPGKEQYEIRKKNILKYGGPEAAIANGYAALHFGKGGEPVYGNEKAMFEAPAGAPAWAVNQRALWRAYRLFNHWWFDERQMDDGQIGGHFNDDPEFAARWWAILALMSDEKARTAYRKLADGLWGSGRLRNGYLLDNYNLEHSNEETTLTEPYALFLHYGNPTYVERCLLTAKNLEWWSALNAKGHRHILADRFSGETLGSNRNEESYEAAQALLPGGFALWYADIPGLRQLLVEYTKTYAAHDGKPQAGCIQVKDHSAAANLSCMVYEATGDASLLSAASTKREWGLRQRQRSTIGGPGRAFFEAPAIRGEVQRLLVTEYVHTRGQPLSDRIHRNMTDKGRELRLAFQATHVSLGLPAPHKAEDTSLFIGWEGMDPDAFAALVTGGDTKSAKAEVYNFTDRELPGRMRLFRVEWGEYGVKAPGAPATMTLRRGDTVPFTVPPKGTAAIEIAQTKSLGEVRGLADPGLGFQDVHADGGKLLVRIHNIGSKDAAGVVVRAFDAAGTRIGEETIESLPAPADLLSRERDLAFPWPGKAGDRVRIEVDPEDRIPEITEGNNRFEGEVRAGPLPAPVRSYWTKGK